MRELEVLLKRIGFDSEAELHLSSFTELREIQLRLMGALEADALEAEPRLYRWNQTKLCEFVWQQGLKRYGSELADLAGVLSEAEDTFLRS